MLEKLKYASVIELLVWMGSAFLTGIGLGTFFSSYLRYIAPWVLFVGLLVHGTMMIIIYRKAA